MFKDFQKLELWEVELPRLVHGESMFEGCKKLKTVNTALSNLAWGERMFAGCSSLTDVKIDDTISLFGWMSHDGGAKMFDDCRLSLNSCLHIIKNLYNVGSLS